MAASTVVIRVAGTDITNKVLFDSASFESQMGALPGTFEFTIKDSARTLSFTTGAEVTLDVDGARLYGGYLTQVSRKFAFPVDITVPDASKVKTRQWVLRGVDYNILFDKRILRNDNDYVHHLKIYPAGSEIGALVKNPLCSKYLDIPAGFDTTTMVTATVTDAPDEEGSFVEQGSTWRQQMEDFARWGVVYYINAQKQLYVKEVEESVAKWQFADKPNRYPIPVGYEYLPTIGFREGEFTEDGTLIVNDALVWGGAGGAGTQGVVFARRTNEASIDYRGRWQMAETHYGEWTRQARVSARANVIVDGNVGGTGGQGDLTRGYVNPQRMAKVIWFSHLVPTDPNLGNAKSHLRPGDITTFILYALGTDLTHPLILDLPLRSMLITFPGLDPQGKAYVQFEGTFGLQLSDPWWLWKYLRDRRSEAAPQVLVSATSEPVGGSDPGVSYGTTGTYSLLPAPDGANKVFHLPNDAAYLNGSTEIYVNGLRYFSPANYTESDPTTGQITFVVAPATTDQLSATVVLSGFSSSTEPVPETGFFMSPGGSDSNSGAIGSPWATMQRFIDSNPPPGSVLYLRNGTYTNSPSAISGHGNGRLLGSSAAPITIRSYPGETATFFHTSGAHGPVLGLAPDDVNNQAGTTYVVIDGVRFENIHPGDSGAIYVGAWSSNYAWCHHITVRNCYFSLQSGTTQRSHGIYVSSGSDYITAENNVFVGPGDSSSGGAGFEDYHVPASNHFNIHHNIFTGWKNSSGGAGIQIWDDDAITTGTIRHNTFIDNAVDCDITHHGPITVRDNAFRDTGISTIYDPNGGSLTADHNFTGQTFDGSYYLLAGNTGKNAASDGTDAGALDN